MRYEFSGWWLLLPVVTVFYLGYLTGATWG